jgi:2,3-bisphosphoglycerate-independent phosphoglycerate mutase
VTLAKTPKFDILKEKYAYTELCASSQCVGLPKNQPGNSEAGHLNLGAGRIVKDDAVYITESIKDGTFFRNPAFMEGLLHCRQNKSKIHLIGLVTEENSAHSSPGHWLAMLRFLEQEKIEEVFLHLFTDGRDSSQHSAIKILERFEKSVKNNHNGNGHKIKTIVASIIGRVYPMDRTKQWGNVEKAYDLFTLGKGFKVNSANEAIVQAYNRKETDEFISPTAIVNKEGKPAALIEDNDVVIFLNLRSDRARELTKAFVQKDFNKKNPNSFRRERWPQNLFFIALTDFGPDLDNARVAFPSREIKNSLPMVLDGMKQFYIAETEKYAHVTYFFNGGYDHPVSGEERVVIDSPKVNHYDLTPLMSANRVCKRTLEEIIRQPLAQRPDFILINFCNPDMLGHTGNIQAAIKGIECVDENLGKLVEAAQKENYFIIVTADHGNAEEMINLKTGEIEPSHTTNPVPFILITPQNKKIKLKNNGELADVAPTILDLMDLKEPKEMTGKSLILKIKNKI